LPKYKHWNGPKSKKWCDVLIIILIQKFELFLSLMEEKNPQICIFFVLWNYKSNLQPLEIILKILKMCIHNTFQALDCIINSNATFSYSIWLSIKTCVKHHWKATL
jgi:hypothetical protein